MADGNTSHADLRRTPLFALHQALGARMVPFAGWEMPVQYPMGVLREHLHTRTAAGLFDVSHMGQVILRHPGGAPGAAAALERLCPQDFGALAEGRQRYGLFTSAAGGILDDLMVANFGDHLFLVVNAANADADVAHLRAGLPDCTVEPLTDRALIALQGPGAEAALAALAPGVAGMRFMDARIVAVPGGEIRVSRSGYTGEDGFEISLPAAEAEGFARARVGHRARYLARRGGSGLGDPEGPPPGWRARGRVPGRSAHPGTDHPWRPPHPRGPAPRGAGAHAGRHRAVRGRCRR